MILKPYKVAIWGIFASCALLYSLPSSAQNVLPVRWLSFEELETALKKEPKPVFIDFYTDWCTYCRKMDKVVFTKPEVIDLLNKEYYAVRFDAETDLEVTFEGQIFKNEEIGKSRIPIHQLARLLASRNGTFAPPTMVILDEEFNVTARYFEYMSSKRMLRALAL